MKRSLTGWQQEIEKFKTGNKLLVAQRYQFAHDWMNIDIVEGEWSAFKQIFSRKSKQMDDQIPALQEKIAKEESNVIEKMRELEEDWKANKPSKGNVLPAKALELLTRI